MELRSILLPVKRSLCRRAAQAGAKGSEQVEEIRLTAEERNPLQKSARLDQELVNVLGSRTLLSSSKSMGWYLIQSKFIL